MDNFASTPNKSSNMEGLKATTCKVIAFYIEDKKSGTFTIYGDMPGGPIITASNLDEAKEKFSEALRLSFAVRNLYFYKDAFIVDQQRKKASLMKFKEHCPPIEFEELSSLTA